MVRKVFVTIAATLFVSSMVFAQGDNLVIPYLLKTNTPVTVDGNLSEWNFVFPIDFNRGSIPASSRAHAWLPESDVDCSGTIMLMYDDDNFYFAARVRDDASGHFSEVSWAADAVELYLSNRDIGDALHGDHTGFLDDAATKVYDLQLSISFDESLDSVRIQSFYNIVGVINSARTTAKYQIWEAGDGYTIEGKVAWADLVSPTTGNSMKFTEGTRVAATWSLFDIDESENSADFRGYQYSPNPPYEGPANWQYVNIKGNALLITRVLSPQQEGVAPKSFGLSQNYPNPFNPTTTIQYSVERPGNVSLKIYNLTGQLVQTVFENVKKQPGDYTINVDMRQHPSGIYFYVLEQGDHRLTQKMAFVK